jgi:flagellar biosynthesis activator protein FlaF
MHHGARRYQRASEATLSAHETEQAAFANIIRGLEEADTDTKRIRTLGRNHDLWSALVKDLAMDSNRLPAPLKSSLIELGLWSMRYSTLAILKKLSLEPLIEVNRNIADGLALQQSAAVTLAAAETTSFTAA